MNPNHESEMLESVYEVASLLRKLKFLMEEKNLFPPIHEDVFENFFPATLFNRNEMYRHFAVRYAQLN